MARSDRSRFFTAELARATGKRFPKLEQAIEDADAQVQEDAVRAVRELTGKISELERKVREGRFW